MGTIDIETSIILYDHRVNIEYLTALTQCGDWSNIDAVEDIVNKIVVLN